MRDQQRTGRAARGARVAGIGALTLAGVLAGVGAGVAAGASGTWEAPGDTIVRIAGDAANGFSVHYKDGSTLYPPTDSEAHAECLELDRRWQRTACKAEVRTWYRDLAATKRALAWQAELHRRELAERR